MRVRALLFGVVFDSAFGSAQVQECKTCFGVLLSRASFADGWGAKAAGLHFFALTEHNYSEAGSP